MAEERIDIVVAQRGATEVRRDIEGLGQGARESSPALQALKAAIEAVGSMTDRLKSALGGAAGPVRELKRLTDDLNKAMTSAAGTNFTTSLVEVAQSLGAVSAAAVRAAGGITALGDTFIVLSSSVGRALAVLAPTATSLTALGSAFGPAAQGAASTSVAVTSTSTALSTMNITIAELSRRIIALGILLAALRDRFSGLRIEGGLGQIADLSSKMRDVTPAVQPASQALLTFQGSAQAAGAAVGGPFAGAFQRLQGMWGTFTNGVRGVWNAVTGMAGAIGGAIPPINNIGAGMTAAGGAASGATQGVNALTSSFFSLWRILLALAIIRQVLSALADSIDTWTQMSNKLRQVSTDSQNLVASQEAVYQSAQRTRSGMEEIATLYTRTAMAVKTLGLSQREVMDITETVAMAMKLNGGSVQETASAMRQLSQAFNKGKLDGDEFRSIMENAPALQKVFTQALKVTTGELMKMSEEGKLTLPKLIDALKQAVPEVRAAFGNSLPLISEGFTYLGNAVTRFLGRLNEATGFSLGFYRAMQFLGDNLGVIGVALAFVGTAMVITFGPTAVSMLVSFGAALGLATGGLSLIVPLLAAAAAALYAWGDSWKVTADGVTVLDYVRAGLQLIGEYLPQLFRLWSSSWEAMFTVVSSLGSVLTSVFGASLGNIGSTIVSVIGTIVGAFQGASNAIPVAFQNLPSALQAVFQTAMNAAVQVVQDGLNGIVSAINSVFQRLSIPLVPNIDLSSWKKEIDTGALDIGSKVGEAFNKGMQTGRDATKDLVDTVDKAMTTFSDRARKIAEQRRAIELSTPQLSTTRGPNTFKPTVEDDGSIDKLQNKLNTLLRTLDPITGANEKLRQGTETLNKAFDAGLITMERRDDLLRRLNEHLRDQLDPLGKINRDMEKEAGLLRLGNDEREIQRQLLNDIEKLRKAGVILSPVEQNQLEGQIRALQALRSQAKLLEDVLVRTFKSAEDAFIEFIEKGKVNFSKLITSLISDLARLAFQQFVTKPLAGLLQSALGGLLGGITGGTTTGGFLGGLSSLFSGLLGGKGYSPSFAESRFATGGSWVVGGSGGVDSQMVNFRASPGERITVERGGSGGGGGTTVIFQIQTPDVRGFKASESQIAARMQRLASRGTRNM